jgi:hypothetical protein
MEERIVSFNGKNIKLYNVAPIDLYLYKRGYDILLHSIKTSCNNTIKFLKNHHLTPLHKVLKYKDKNNIIFILSELNVYDYVKEKKEKYEKKKILTFYEKNRLNHYKYMEKKLLYINYNL